MFNKDDNLYELAKSYLRMFLERSAEELFGVEDAEWVNQVTEAWMNDASNSKCRYDEMSQILGSDYLKKEKM